MNFFDIDEYRDIVKSNDKVIFGCPFYLKIKETLINNIIDDFIWADGYRVIVYTDEQRFAASLFSSLKKELDKMQLSYNYDPSTYKLSDDNSEVVIFIISKKIHIKYPYKYFDETYVLFVEDVVENILEKFLIMSKKAVFLTYDTDKSIYYSLDDESYFYRLRSNYSSEKISEYKSKGSYDLKQLRLIGGFFNKKN